MGVFVALGACGTSDGPETGTVPATADAKPAASGITAEADAPLRSMSEYLAGLNRFTVHTEGSVEVVLENGQKLSFPYSSDVKVRRPDRLRSDRVGEATKLHFYYDGETFTLHGEGKNLYARAEAPPHLDAAIEAARERLGLEAPGADLLFEDVYATLTEDVVSGFRVGTAHIEGVPCHHLAFRGEEVDFQIWIEDDETPLPRRLVITSKKVEGAPEFVVELSRWDTTTELPDDVFEFTPPPGAQEIEFLPHRPETKT